MTSHFWGRSLLSTRLSGQGTCMDYLRGPDAGCHTHFLSFLRYPCFSPGGKVCEEKLKARASEKQPSHYAFDQLSPGCSGIIGIICEA